MSTDKTRTSEIVAKLNWYLTEAPDLTGILTVAYKAANRLEDLQAQVDAMQHVRNEWEHTPRKSHDVELMLRELARPLDGGDE